MMRFANSEERISAWLDGVMTPQEQELFAVDWEQYPEFAAMAERLAAQDQLLAATFPLEEETALDPAFLARIGLTPKNADIINFAQVQDERRAVPAPIRRYWPAAFVGALAASLALFMLLTPNDDADISRTPAFAAALDQTPSRDSTQLTDDARLTPMLSFASADGRYCREFALATRGSARAGIACKSNAGWQIEAWGGPAKPVTDSNEILAAGGANDPVLDTAYDRLDASDPMSAEAETALIRSKWADGK